MLSHLSSIASIRRPLLCSPITHFFAQRGRAHTECAVPEGGRKRRFINCFKFTLAHPVFSSLSGSGNWVWGAERGKEKRKEGRKEERESERGGLGRRRNGAEIYGVLRRPWLFLSPFHTLVFKILAQWSFFDEFLLWQSDQ